MRFGREKIYKRLYDPLTYSYSLIEERVALLPLNYTRYEIIITYKYSFFYCFPSPEFDRFYVLFSGMESRNYELPLRAANKTITNGPDATIKAKMVSCAITSKFIPVQPLLFRGSRKSAQEDIAATNWNRYNNNEPISFIRNRLNIKRKL